jgi:DNA processing protein
MFGRAERQLWREFGEQAMCHGSLAPVSADLIQDARRFAKLVYNRCQKVGLRSETCGGLDLLAFCAAPLTGGALMDGRSETTGAERLELVALSLLPISLYGEIANRIRQGQHPVVVLDGLLAGRWPHEPGRRSELLCRARTSLAHAADLGLTSIVWADLAYPPLLSAIVDPPPAMWARGSLAALDQPAVAIVGSRAASPYAIAVAEQVAGDLAAAGVTVVSGLARGVDSAAHRGALAAGGSTIAVFGSGADVIYPAEHAALAREITARGLVISELVPGTRPLSHFFPRRNRIISGLSRAVVIVEAGEYSGSLITARAALDQGRDVLAVPGNILSGRNRGGHALLRDGAKIVETADDILEELGMIGAGRGSAPRLPGPLHSSSGPPDAVLACLAVGEPCDLDEIRARLGLPPARLLARLFDLELRGMVRRLGGGRFVRVDRPW